MDKRVTILLFFGFLVFCCYGQKLEESIVWNSNERLQWSNFKGIVPADASPAATTASGISYQYSANLLHHEVDLDFEVNAYFYPNESWYKPEACDDLILSHEQLHFDISEIFARKMRFTLRRTAFTKDVKNEVRKIYKETIKELADFQEKYDWETNFSRNKTKQIEWNARIAEALQSIKE